MNNSKIFDLSPYPLLQQIGQTPLVQVDLTRDQFPGIEVYAKAEMLNPGGSIKDDEIITKANDLGVSMVFTNARHFLH